MISKVTCKKPPAKFIPVDVHITLTTREELNAFITMIGETSTAGYSGNTLMELYEALRATTGS